MDELPEIYADGVGEITVTGSVVRIDLVSLSVAQKDENGRPKPVVRKRIVMPVDGFLRTYAVIGNVLQKMEQAGLVRRQQAVGGDGTQSGGPSTPGNGGAGPFDRG